MDSPLRPVIANIFMAELESVLIPKLINHVKNWRRLVNETFAYVKGGSIEYVLSVINSFHDNIKNTYEKESNNRLLFVDVLFIMHHEKINTTVFRKDTHNKI